ncbi:hypothetical protein PO909_001862, partial [Leuciscus waleckii]
CSELTLEGAQQHHSHRPFYRESRPFQASRGQHNRGGARPKHQSERSERFWDRQHPSNHPKDGSTWEASRRPRKSRSPSPRTPSPESRQWNPSRHDTGKLKSESTSERNSAATSETAEILRVLKWLLHKRDKKDEPDILCLSIRPEPSTQNTARQPQATELTVTSKSDSTAQSPKLTAAHPEQDSTISHTWDQNPKGPENSVLDICLRSEPHETGPNRLSITTPAGEPDRKGGGPETLPSPHFGKGGDT